jgi:hypothetical protein
LRAFAGRIVVPRRIGGKIPRRLGVLAVSLACGPPSGDYQVWLDTAPKGTFRAWLRRLFPAPKPGIII